MAQRLIDNLVDINFQLTKSYISRLKKLGFVLAILNININHTHVSIWFKSTNIKKIYG